MKRTLEDINQNEINTAPYFKRAREIRRRRIEDVVCGTLLLVLLAATFTMVQVAYGIW